MIDFLSQLTFANPWLLSLILSLPLLWWILKILPPKPKELDFGGCYFLNDLKTTEKAAQKTPWWVLLIRICIIAFIITAFSAPHEKITHYQPNDNTTIIIIDNDWASAQNWEDLKNQAKLILEENLNYKKEVKIIATTAPSDSFHFTKRAEAIDVINTLKPHPLEADYSRLSKYIETLKTDNGLDIFYLNNAITTQKEYNLLSHLNTVSSLTIFGSKQPIFWFKQHDDRLMVKRSSTNLDTVNIQIKDTHKNLITTVNKTFKSNSYSLELSLKEIPREALLEMEHLTIQDQKHAGAHYWKKTNLKTKNIGVILNTLENTHLTENYLSPYFYLNKALSPYHTLTFSPLSKDLIKESHVLILADSSQLPKEDTRKITSFIENGGIFIRFADSYLAKGDLSEITPVPLRKSDRNLNTALSWQTPQKLANFPLNSPFSHLNIPDEIEVNKQIVAEPSLDLLEHAIAILNDGTPLITARKQKAGWNILFHISATPEWSNLPLSGLFLEQLNILTNMSSSNNSSTAKKETDSLFFLTEKIDPYGALTAATRQEKPLKTPLNHNFILSKDTPAGIYKNDQTILNINVGDFIKLHTSQIIDSIGSDFSIIEYQKKSNIHYKPLLLMIACALFIIDLIYISAVNKGFLILAFIIMTTAPAHAQQNISKETSQTYLAYIKTGDPHLDKISQYGLTTLAQEATRRTSADLGGITGLNLLTDSLQPYPLIYWPISSQASAYPPQLSTETILKIQNYFNSGGIILIDTKDQYNTNNTNVMTYGSKTRVLQNLFYHMQTPPMLKLPDDHVLTRSFYLLKSAPGLYQNNGLWIATTDNSKNDGVTPLIIGGNDWATAWAKNEHGVPLTTLPQEQREHSYRFGINLILYALTGNYKDDQMHIPLILERLDH